MAASLVSLRQQLYKQGHVYFETPPSHAPRWSCASLAGRLVEVMGNARMTAAVRLVVDAQREGESVAWLAPIHRLPFPPHLDANGVDLAALIVVHTPSAAAARAADYLLRSDALGLVVIDVDDQQVPQPLLSRLLGLAQKNHVTVIFLQGGEQGLGSLIAVRVVTRRAHHNPGEFTYEVIAQKDKAFGPSWRHIEACRGPLGLR